MALFENRMLRMLAEGARAGNLSPLESVYFINRQNRVITNVQTETSVQQEFIGLITIQVSQISLIWILIILM